MESSVVENRWHVHDGIRLEVLAAMAASGGSDGGGSSPSPRSPLLLIHGAFHGAWCWAELFLPFFAAAGHDCYALSLRGHGASELSKHPAGGAATVETHLDDIASFVATLARPPVLVVHSATGLLAAFYASQVGQGAGGRPPLAGLAFLASSPPSGNGPMARRNLWRSPLQTLRVVRAMITQSFKASSAACRALFFSPALPGDATERYRAALAAGPKLTLIADRAAAEGRWPRPPAGGWPGLPPRRVFVGWGAGDALVDQRAAEETAEFYGARLTVWEDGLAHDVMLDVGWRSAAGSLLAWLEERVDASSAAAASCSVCPA